MRVLRCIRKIIWWIFAVPAALVLIALGVVFYRWKREENDAGEPVTAAAPGEETENNEDKIRRSLQEAGPWQHRCFMTRYITPRTRLPNGQ